MAKIRFTRDEVILALDTYYSANGKGLSPNSQAIGQLCELLRSLPIHPDSQCKADFRSCLGVAHQLAQFRVGEKQHRTDTNIGIIFYTVAEEFAEKPQELHAAAEAIRRNLPYFTGTYGAEEEADGFPEGALLGHLHQTLERRDGAKSPRAPRCAICQLEPEALYQPCGALLEQHLLVPPTELDGGKKYKPGDYITVCPNCHAALHRYRPWLNKENCGDLLRG